MGPQDNRRERRAINVPAGQLGDINADNIVGGDIYAGANADDMLAFIKEYVWNDVMQSDIERDRLRADLNTARLELWLWRILVIAGILYELVRGL